MSVVLPAPFSPTRAWIEPGRTVSDTWSLATRRPNVLVTSISSTAGGEAPEVGSWTGLTGLLSPVAPPASMVPGGHGACYVRRRHAREACPRRVPAVLPKEEQ